MTTPSNPADRLLQVIHDAKKLSEGEKNIRADGAFVRILRARDTPQLLRRLSQLVDLPEQIARQIRSIDNINHELHLQWLTNVQRTLGQLNFNLPFSRFTDPITAEDLYGLKLCKDSLDRYPTGTEPTRQELERILEQVNGLRDSLDNSDTEENLRSFIIERLEEIEAAIEDFAFGGSIPLQRAIESTAFTAGAIEVAN